MTDKTTTMTDDEVHAILNEARFGDTLTVVRTNGGDLTSTVSGRVLGDQSLSPAVGIDMLDGGPYIVRENSGAIWGQFLRVTLKKGDTITVDDFDTEELRSAGYRAPEGTRGQSREAA